MPTGRFRFDEFLIDCGDRQLRRNGEPVELNARYFDALALLVAEQGRLVSKDRFLDEVWRGVPVTDEALTQCISALRRQLGDDVARPRFIETVPKHGYRFVARVEPDENGCARSGPAAPAWSRDFWLLGLAGTAGGGVAGLVGGLVYGFAAGSDPLQPGTGAVSVLLVLVVVTAVLAMVGAAGVSFGIAAAVRWWSNRPSAIVAGGAVGGLVVGALVKLLAIDAFNLLVGRSPGDITGAAEGALLGAAIGVGAWLGTDALRRSAALAAVAGGVAGLAIALLGGRLMGGSLDLLARHFPDSRLRLDGLGLLLGESGLGPISHLLTAGLEGALFAGCVVGAMVLARRRLVASAEPQ